MSANTEQQHGIAHLPTLSDLTGDQIAEASRAAGEPEWLTEWRAQAWEFFAQAAPPQWRRTNLTRLQPADISPTLAPQGTDIQWDETAAAQGVVCTTLAAAMQSYGELIREKIGTAVEPLANKFSALRAALWQDGLFLYVPKNVELETPIHVSYTLVDGSLAIFPYTLVILERNARAILLEEFAAPARLETALVAPTTEIFAGEGSSINYVTAQHNGTGIHHVGGQMVVLDRDASSEWASLSLGGQVQHIEAEARLQGDGSRVNWVGATFANQEQNLVIAPWLRHVGANAESMMDFKTVVTGNGYSVFDGMIKIEHESRGSVTRLEEHATHLSETSRSDSIPGLKIDTNDVAKAGHASTSGRVDEEQLFYMQSRGIEKTEAQRLIVMGLFEPALNAIPLEHVRERLTEEIEAKI